VNTLILIVAVCYGACIGSFLNVCIFRLPRRCLRLWRPKLSFCPKCNRTLPWYENIPVLAYLFLGGRCRGCRVKIPVRYFLVELATVFLFLYVAWRCLVVPSAHGFDRRVGEAFAFAGLGAALLVCGVIDAEWRIIPDEIDVPGFLLAPVVLALVPSILGGRAPDVIGDAVSLKVALQSALPWWGAPPTLVSLVTWPLERIETLQYTTWEPHVRGAAGSILGAAAGGGLIFAIGWLGDRVFASSEGAMGFGDVKFMAMIGGFTGWQGVLGTIAIASMTGSVFGITSKFATGKRIVTGKELAETTFLGYAALRIFGAPREAPDEETLRLRPGGWIAAKFATGEPYVPFGPFLALGAFLVALWPSEVWEFFLWMGERFQHLVGGLAHLG
jgi:leader peptidase (prepilin peptidase)/N-methyltransferase